MRRMLFIVVPVVLVAGAAATRADWKGLVGKPAPPLGVGEWVHPAEGRTLADLEGRMVLVAFLAPARPQTLSALPRLSELRAVYGSKGLRVLGVILDAETNLAAFAAEQRIEFSIGAAGKRPCLADGPGVGGDMDRLVGSLLGSLPDGREPVETLLTERLTNETMPAAPVRAVAGLGCRRPRDRRGWRWRNRHRR